MAKSKQQVTFGDFQTPLDLARRVAALVKLHESTDIRTIFEPTCGLGSFLQASAEAFGATSEYWGFDLNFEYVETARGALAQMDSISGHVEQKDFYAIDWKTFLSEQPSPLLLIGNPPWITNAAMGAIGGQNLPEKSNFQRHKGFAAKTGKANFDISEWMLIRLLEALQGKQAVVAMLCKTATARKVLRHAWLNGLDAGPSSLHLIDASAEFGVSVDACLFYTHTGFDDTEPTANVFGDLSFDKPKQTFGLFAGELVSDIDAYRELYDLDGLEYRKWRSGVKHDAAKVMEFTRENGVYVNGLGERYELEDDYLFPLLKSSDLANGRLQPSRYVLLTQRRVADPTDEIMTTAPKTWQYLLDHSAQLDKRGSSIYLNRPRFSVFGIGDYSFAPAKVAISGLYKNIRFQALGSDDGKPVMVDDTCYFIPCNSESEAEFFADLLNSETAQRFISALVFKDAKRPVTIDILRRIDLKKLAEYKGKELIAAEYLSSPALETSNQYLMVFEGKERY
ncbi:MAG TPA: SAM-dependent DNA methyltransferase [Chlorobaculum parvum]|uniref:SAM-dependent DNA methyltransferase n=1 Tax=Chlorobaculum parvum TaxID=274539 RepID=A0A7C5H8E4_9CHLB|nr:SAM-dependent DNA methyltransferase [Chlorobaculum parvum]